MTNMSLFAAFQKEFPDVTVMDIGTNKDMKYNPKVIYVKELKGNNYHMSEEHFVLLSQQIRINPHVAAFIKQNNMSEEQILQLTKQIYSQQNLSHMADKNDIIIVQYQHFAFMCTSNEQENVFVKLRKIQRNNLKPAEKCLICFDEINQVLINSCIQCLDGMCQSCASHNMGSHNAEAEGIISKCPKCRKRMVIKN